MQWQAVLQASEPEATLVKRRSGARFDVDGRSSRSKTAPAAPPVCATVATLSTRYCDALLTGTKCLSRHSIIIFYLVSQPPRPSMQTRQRARDTRSSATPALLFESFTRTNYAKRAFRCLAPAVWNSLSRTVLDCVTLSTFKSTIKTFLFKIFVSAG